MIETNIAVIILSYLLGSISFSYILTKKIKKVDIRKVGSGNAGATNTLRVLGVGPALSVLFLDASKGIVAVLLGRYLGGGNEWTIALCGLASIIGHNWPIFFGFKGGKGVATTIGAMAMMAFFPALYAGIATIIIIALFRYVSLGALAFMTLTTVLTYVMGYPKPYFYFALIVMFLSFWRHSSNIKRLISGSESKLGKKI